MQYGSSSKGIWEMFESLLSVASALAEYPENRNATQSNAMLLGRSLMNI